MRKTNLDTRVRRIRRKIIANAFKSGCPRLTVFRSNHYIYAQIIDDKAGKTLVSANEKEVKIEGTKTQRAEKVGEILAERAESKKINKVVFDRGLYKFHGRVKALAEGARRKGLEF